ncbi:MAG: hypothetical protein IJY86_11885 [Clostridia bacterium]|nr:hypothetical protein [Clostridia bacterium]
MRKALALGLVFVMAMTAVFAIPASGLNLYTLTSPGCSCSYSFTGGYGCEITGSSTGTAVTICEHYCEKVTVYVSVKSWIYGSSYNNYTSRTITGTSSSMYDHDVVTVSRNPDYTGTVYSIRALESYHKVTIKCNGVERVTQASENVGDLPMVVVPPVVVS